MSRDKDGQAIVFRMWCESELSVYPWVEAIDNDDELWLYSFRFVNFRIVKSLFAAATVAELEGMIHSQNQLMDKLSNECHALTQKLEDASTRHK